MGRKQSNFRGMLAMHATKAGNSPIWQCTPLKKEGNSLLFQRCTLPNGAILGLVSGGVQQCCTSYPKKKVFFWIFSTNIRYPGGTSEYQTIHKVLCSRTKFSTAVQLKIQYRRVELYLVSKKQTSFLGIFSTNIRYPGGTSEYQTSIKYYAAVRIAVRIVI